MSALGVYALALAVFALVLCLWCARHSTRAKLRRCRRRFYLLSRPR